MEKINLQENFDSTDDWDEATRENWEEKMSEPFTFKKLSQEEIEELRRQGYNV